MCGCVEREARLREAMQGLMIAADMAKQRFEELAAMERASRPGSPIADIWQGNARVMAQAIRQAADAGR